MWGLKPPQTQEAGEILREITQDWRALLAGSEGFLTSKQRRSTFRKQVAWGEQDSMVCKRCRCDNVLVVLFGSSFS